MRDSIPRPRSMTTLAAPVQNLSRASDIRKWWSHGQSSRLILRLSDSLRIQGLVRCASAGGVVVNGRGSCGCIHPACRLSAICFNGDLGHREGDALLTSTRHFSLFRLRIGLARKSLAWAQEMGWNKRRFCLCGMQGVEEDHS
jgi:hypothetical protein